MDNYWGLELALSQQQAIAAAVDQWVTGIPGRIPGHTVFVENAGHSSYAKEIAGDGSVVLVIDGDADDPDLVTVKGRFDESGEELLVDGSLSIEIQDYLAVPFISLVGPTVVRFAGQDDWQSFFDDADEARQSGHFVRQLTEVNAVLAERALLAGHGNPDSKLARIHITANGTILSGPSGTVIGWVGDDLQDIRARATPLKPESSIASLTHAPEVVAALNNRPWVPRYLAALDAWKFIGPEQRAGTRLVGFGLSLYGATESHGLPLPNAPFILERQGEHRLLDTNTGRVFTIGRDAAVLMEAISNLRGVEAAVSVTAGSMGISPELAESSAKAVMGQLSHLGIDLLGRR